MRRTIFQSARQTAARETSTINHQTRHICIACRRAAFEPVRLTSRPHGRFISSTRSVQQQEAATASARPTQQQNTAPSSHYDFFPQTFPGGSKSPFTPDLRILRTEFLQLQAKAHPDLASADRKRQAEALSSLINEAYKTLQDPLRRAQYLLSLQGIDVEDESAKLTGGDLLMEVMEAREAVDEVESEEELEALREENKGRVAASVEVLEDAFENAQWEDAAREAIRLRFWVNIAESIQGWEKGQGGGAIHH